MDNYLASASELRTGINEKLQEAGIVIAFPQRDVHLDTSSPLEIHMRQVPAPAGPGGPAE